MTSGPVVLVALPLLAAALAALARPRRWVRRVIAIATVATVGVVGGVLTVAATRGGPVATVLGGTDARYRIVLIADAFASLATVAVAVVALAVLAAMAIREDDHHPFLVPVVLVMLAGVWGSFVTGDLFNLFVFFEVTLVASYVLLVIGGTRAQARAGAVYVTVNLLGSLLFLAGVGLLYGATGTVNLAVLATEAPRPPVRAVAEAVVVLAFALKAALLPLGGWLRVAYPVATRTVAALFAAVLTTVGAVAIYRVVPLAFGIGGIRAALMYAAASTVVVAGLAALAVPGIWRMASLVVMAQAGFMIVGVGAGGRIGVAAGAAFIVQDVIVKGAFFLALSAAGDVDTDGRDLMAARPVLGATLLVPLASLAGLPLTPGFVGKALIVRSALNGEEVLVAGAVLLGSLLILGVGARIVREIAWSRVDVEPGPGAASAIRRRWAVAPAAALAALVLVMGTVPLWLDASEAGAALLTDPVRYAEVVLG